MLTKLDKYYTGLLKPVKPADGSLWYEDGQVWLDGQLIPGILVAQSVRCAVRYDEAQLDNRSGKKKVIKGWEDATIALTLDLLSYQDDGDNMDCYEKLAVIDALFKSAKDSLPVVYNITGTRSHAWARGIRQVIFDSLDSTEDDQEDTIQVTITFVEHLPAVTRREQQAAKQSKLNGKAPQVKAQPASDPKIVQDPESPFLAGVKTGLNGGVQ